MNETPAVVCRQLVKRYPDVVAVAGLDLSVRAGECMAVLGPNGAGKTTTVEMIEGLTEPTAGEIEVLGEVWGRSHHGDRAIRSALGVQLQETHFQERLTVRETIELFQAFYERSRPAAELIGLVALEAKAAARVGKLSGGQKQRLALACALVGSPRLLCLDEPTTGLDPQSRRQIWEIVERFKADGGTVVLTTHYMEEAARLADRVAIMDHGRIIALDTASALIASLGAEDIVELDCDRPLPPERLAELPGVGEARAEPGGRRVRLSVRDIGLTLPALLALIAEHGARLDGLVTHRATLEDVFVHHTGRGLRDE
jgi:ABC-2 type transport system ATP-binding protein